MIGPKTRPMPPGAAPLHDEQPDEDHDRDRDRPSRRRRWWHLEALDRAEHRDRRRDDAVAVEQRRAEDAERDDEAARWASVPSA